MIILHRDGSLTTDAAPKHVARQGKDTIEVSEDLLVQQPDLIDRIPAIAAPTLVMIGEWDDFLPCALRDHELIPGSRLVVRKRCGHGSRWRLDTFLREVEHFLDDVEAGREVAGRREV